MDGEKRWIYHSTEKPKIVLESEAEKFYADGWAKTPAAFKKETLSNEIKTALDGLVRLESMKKTELLEFAENSFGEKLNQALNKQELIDAILTIAEEKKATTHDHSA